MENNSAQNIKQEVIVIDGRLGVVKAVKSAMTFQKVKVTIEDDLFATETERMELRPNRAEITGHERENGRSDSMVLGMMAEVIDNAQSNNIVIVVPDAVARRVFELRGKVNEKWTLAELQTGKDGKSGLIKPWMAKEDHDLAKSIVLLAKSWINAMNDGKAVKIMMSHNLNQWRFHHEIGNEALEELGICGKTIYFENGTAEVEFEGGIAEIYLENNRVSGNLEVKKTANGDFYVDRKGNRTTEFVTAQRLWAGLQKLLPTDIEATHAQSA